MMKSSLLLVFLALGYVASAAPELPLGSNLKHYLEDTPTPPDDESDSQELMDEMKEQQQGSQLQEVDYQQAFPNFRGESLQL